MGFVSEIYSNKYSNYLARYLAEVPEALQKNHNYWYPMDNGSLSLIEDAERQMALLIINGVIASPGEDHPAAYAFFVGKDIMLLQADKEGVFCDFDQKKRGVLYKILSYQVPLSLIGRENELRQWIIESIICLADSYNDKFIKTTHVEVLFDQKFTPRNIPR